MRSSSAWLAAAAPDAPPAFVERRLGVVFMASDMETDSLFGADLTPFGRCPFLVGENHPRLVLAGDTVGNEHLVVLRLDTCVCESRERIGAVGVVQVLSLQAKEVAGRITERSGHEQVRAIVGADVELADRVRDLTDTRHDDPRLTAVDGEDDALRSINIDDEPLPKHCSIPGPD